MTWRGMQVLVVVGGLGWLTASRCAETPPPIPVADFARHSLYGVPSMSPNGEYLAVSVHDEADAAEDDKYEVGVFHLPDMKPVSRMDMPRKTMPAQIAWVSNTRLIVIPALQLGWLDEPQRTGDFFTVDYDGRNQRSMNNLLRAAQAHGLPIGPGVFSGLPPRPNGHFYWTIHSNPSDKVSEGRSDLYDVDAQTGIAASLGGINDDGMQLFAHDDLARIAYGIDDQNKEVLFERDSKDQPWRKLDVHARSMIPLQISDDGTRVYWQYSVDGGPYALAESNFDLSGLKILASDSFGSVGEVMWTPYPRKPFAVTIDTGHPKTIYLDDDTSATIHKALSEQFPGLLLRFAAMSDDGTRVLVQADSDRDPGLYALFTLNPVSFTPLFKMAPWIDPARMAPRTPIRFANTEGTILDGYLTLPSSAGKLPLVLIPHGGPIGLRDRWDYDAWAQFLASRGYAVLQVNYRGSSGRGPAFQLAGYRQFGTGIQQDLLDGVRWAVAQGYADKDRVCIFGASFGGYSALMAPIRAPGMFKCAIDFAGISDFAIEQDKSDIEHTERGRNYLHQALGMDTTQIKAISPLYHLDQFNVPVLIVHGEEDPRVPLKNATKLRDALQKSGKPYEWLVKPKELHGFYSETDNTDFLQHLQTFLGKYLGQSPADSDESRLTNSGL
ncbi:S9 family peptidase [Dyella jejuensis]|uniref:S9 family peptidase n=1 Tax=Dyella jejuensis TaxID=1432009 RepID=A0ABW8JI43_9GAMM